MTWSGPLPGACLVTRRALILVSDSTSHGGVLLDGADTRTLDGRAIACVGRSASQRFADYLCLVRRQGGAWGANKE